MEARAPHFDVTATSGPAVDQVLGTYNQERYVDAPVTNYRLNRAGMERNEAYRARREESHVRVQLEWHGRDPGHDAVIEPSAWRSARRAFALDPSIGRAPVA